MIKQTVLVLIILFALSQTMLAQSSHDVMLSGGVDLIKTDFSNFMEKAQLGLEGNYFVVRNFAVGAGVEIWTERNTSFVMGMRWYPADHVFVRMRGLIGENDVALGAGWAKPIHENWRFEALGDFYVERTEFAFRAGISYIIKTK